MVEQVKATDIEFSVMQSAEMQFTGKNIEWSVEFKKENLNCTEKVQINGKKGLTKENIQEKNFRGVYT